MSTRIATRHDRNGVQPSLYWIVFVLMIGVSAITIQQWRTDGVLEKDNQQLQEQHTMLEGIRAENIHLKGQRDRLLTSLDSSAQQIQSLREAVQQLIERTNELGIAIAARERDSWIIENMKDLSAEKVRLEVELLRLELDSKSRVPRIGAWLGVAISELPEEKRKPDTQGGVFVASVLPGSPAAQAGLKEGDIVLRIDGQLIAGFDDFKNILIQKVGGQLLAMDVFRDDSIVRIDAKPSNWPQ